MPESTAVLVCRVGKPPALEYLPSQNQLEAIQAIVGGYFTNLKLENGLALWSHETGVADDGTPMPLNRKIPGVGVRATGYAFVVDRTNGQGARDGEPGLHHIHGDFLIVRTRGSGITHITAQDIAKYQTLFK